MFLYLSLNIQYYGIIEIQLVISEDSHVGLVVKAPGYKAEDCKF